MLELSKLQMFETYHEKIQPHFGDKNIEEHHCDTDSYLLNKKTSVSFAHLYDRKDFFKMSKSGKDDEIFRNEIEKLFCIYIN